MHQVASLEPGMQGRQVPRHHDIGMVDGPDFVHRSIHEIEGRVHQPPR